MPAATGGAPTADGDAAAAGQPATCQWCPLCAGLAALRESRPEAVEHLMRAGVELLAAARALLDGADTRPGRDGLQRIDIG